MIECKKVELNILGPSANNWEVRIDGERIDNVRAVFAVVRVCEIPTVTIELTPRDLILNGEAVVEIDNADVAPK